MPNGWKHFSIQQMQKQDERDKNLPEYTAGKAESTSDFHTVLQGAPQGSQQGFCQRVPGNLCSPKPGERSLSEASSVA